MARSFWGLGNREMKSDIIEIETSDEIPDGEEFLRNLYFEEWPGNDADTGAIELHELVTAAGYTLKRLDDKTWRGCHVVHLRIQKA